MEAHAGNIITKGWMLFAFEKTCHISLSCQLVQVQYQEHQHVLLKYMYMYMLQKIDNQIYFKYWSANQ